MHAMRSTRTSVFASVFVFGVCAALVACAPPPPYSPELLQDWHAAKAELGPVFAGSPAWHAHMGFVEDQLAEAGVVEVDKYPAPYTRWWAPDQPADQQRDDHAAKADDDGHARAVDRAGEAVASEVVGPQPMRGRGRFHARRDVQNGDVVRRPDKRGDGHEDDETGDTEPGDEASIAHGFREDLVH